MKKESSPIKEPSIEDKLPCLDKSSEKDIDRTKHADMPSMLDEQWLALTQDWQAQPFEKADIQALLKKTKRRTLWAKSLLVVNLIATIGLLSAFTLALYQGSWNKATLVYLGLSSVFSTVFVYYEIKIRRQTWQQYCDSPDKAISHAIAGCKSSIRYVQLLKYSTWLILPLVNVYLFFMIRELDKSPWPAFMTVNVFMMVTWGISHFVHLKRNKELAQLLSLQEGKKNG
jgi:hypothetical protein